MDFDNYDLDPAIYDEMFLQDGTPREHCQQLYETLTEFSPMSSPTSRSASPARSRTRA